MIVQAGPYDSLKDVALRILQNEVATIPIIYSSSEDGSYPQLLHLASLSGILKCKALVSGPNILSWLLLTGGVNLQVFAGTLNIVLAPYLFSKCQFVTFLWVHGFRKLESRTDVL